MVIVVKKEINTCEECEFSKTSKVYTKDSWDDVRKVHCNKLNKDVHTYLDWYDKSDIPEICPLI